jgi:hypothetical protein
VFISPRETEPCPINLSAYKFSARNSRNAFSLFYFLKRDLLPSNSRCIATCLELLPSNGYVYYNIYVFILIYWKSLLGLPTVTTLVSSLPSAFCVLQKISLLPSVQFLRSHPQSADILLSIFPSRRNVFMAYSHWSHPTLSSGNSPCSEHFSSKPRKDASVWLLYRSGIRPKTDPSGCRIKSLKLLLLI